MINLTLSDVVDVFVKSGTAKATKVRQVKNREKYQPATDYYRPLRMSLIDIHASGKDRDALDSILPAITDPKKVANYHELVEAYRSFGAERTLSGSPRLEEPILITAWM